VKDISIYPVVEKRPLYTLKQSDLTEQRGLRHRPNFLEEFTQTN